MYVVTKEIGWRGYDRQGRQFDTRLFSLYAVIYLEQDDAGVVHLAVVVVHELLDALSIVHLGQLVALSPESVADLLDLGLDRRRLV